MGKPTGFLEHGRELPKKLDPSVVSKTTKSSYSTKSLVTRSILRLLVVWTVVSLSVTAVVRLVTSSQNLTMRFTVIAGKKLGTF